MPSANYFSSLDYQARETLRQSLFREDLPLLSNEEIERILSSKIELPSNARLALLQLGGDPHVLVPPRSQEVSDTYLGGHLSLGGQGGREATPRSV